MDLTKLSAYDYSLPENLIAQIAHDPADECKLLYCKVSKDIHLKDLVFKDIVNFLSANDVLFFNNSKVVKARIVGDVKM
jgi:S-adenosylmethionine:tRNA ribosyltransferase-isomerase